MGSSAVKETAYAMLTTRTAPVVKALVTEACPVTSGTENQFRREVHKRFASTWHRFCGNSILAQHEIDYAGKSFPHQRLGKSPRRTPAKSGFD
jgi:hypothetical protein